MPMPAPVFLDEESKTNTQINRSKSLNRFFCETRLSIEPIVSFNFMINRDAGAAIGQKKVEGNVNV